ncbi:hypothetical protein KBZ18_10160 [Synechococcus sp. Cruz-9H2]|uniref:hypothetical protein n=1 Tax=unclassified Synechococcus TaxID=2626047 RepID=UPI0020CD8887|nr:MULTISPECIES: hypothetical protein [unclassified Synechococcus]MCP9819856.1 hypothetical protein [Synechococcus sp. Cruz-9H2]MCP9844078.1 hypothetical protein [Synechococcus sp. Edmonson 11F2]MCP9856286.1 hypothetical protein [Synechococcus sp. Cruz-9C9]MCP9870767.1 hypothetical protein [Synechococcus sp. Cruz-7B9]
MASNPVLFDHSQAGIRWRVIQRLDLAPTGTIEFEKFGKRGCLLHLITVFDAARHHDTDGSQWQTGPGIPKYLARQVAGKLLCEAEAQAQPTAKGARSPVSDSRPSAANGNGAKVKSLRILDH